MEHADKRGSMISALEALNQLRKGNVAFTSNTCEANKFFDSTRRTELVKAQHPFAIVLGCSDSRVPIEYVFCQGPGALFVIRVAGNITAPSQVGSVELAAERFGTRLVVVLGHSRCGAVMATIEEIKRPTGKISRELKTIIDFVRSSVEGLLESGANYDLNALIEEAVRSNIRNSANHLRHESKLLSRLIRDDGLLVVGAEYSLETGGVDFFDGVTKAV